MEKRIKISMMLDYYGSLITPKQKDVMELYFNNDLSLSEISEDTKTSRQAIYDLLKRCEKQLNEYESKLKLVERSLYNENQKRKANELLDKLMDKDVNLKDSGEAIEDLRRIINELF